MVIVIAVVVGIAVVTVLAALLLARRRRTGTTAAGTAADTTAGAPSQHHPDRGPMTGLEDALNQLTDTSGHTIAQRLDQEAPGIDELRIPDDTGPLLRRVLDSLETTADPDADEEGVSDDAAGTADADDGADPAGTSNA